MKKIIALLAFAIAALASTTTQAQKIGYINSAALLAEMPEVKKADANLSALEKQLVKQGEAMQARMQEKYKATMEKAQKNQLSKPEEEQASKELQQMQAELQKFEEKIKRDLAAKREALYSPVLKRVYDMIKVVSKEKGYELILDASTGAIVYADGDKNNITPLVKARLGVAASPGAATAPSVKTTPAATGKPAPKKAGK